MSLTISVYQAMPPLCKLRKLGLGVFTRPTAPTECIDLTWSPPKRQRAEMAPKKRGMKATPKKTQPMKVMKVMKRPKVNKQPRPCSASDPKPGRKTPGIHPRQDQHAPEPNKLAIADGSPTDFANLSEEEQDNVLSTFRNPTGTEYKQFH